MSKEPMFKAGISVEAYERPGDDSAYEINDAIELVNAQTEIVEAFTTDAADDLPDDPNAEAWRTWVDHNEKQREQIVGTFGGMPLVADPNVPYPIGGKWTTKDSGARSFYASGMVRDTDEGKARFDLLVPLGVPYEEQMLTRFANLMARGALKYEARNWEKATGTEELARFKSSAFRHFMQWLTGETDEDHAAAVWFNMDAAEATKYKMEQTQPNGSSKDDGGTRQKDDSETCGECREGFSR